MADDPGEGRTITEKGIWVVMKRGKGKAKLTQVIRFEPSNGGAPRKVLTEDGAYFIETWASRGAILEEIADCMGVHRNTLSAPHNRALAQEAYRTGASRCNISLRRRQVEVAMDGNPRMLEWLGRVRLGQKDQDATASSELAGFVKAMQSRPKGDPEEEE